MAVNYRKRTGFSARTRTRYVRMRLTTDLKPDKNRLAIYDYYECDCSENGVQNLPEWAPVYNQKGDQYKCNIVNMLEVGSYKVAASEFAPYMDWYYMTSKPGAFFIYVEEVGGFYTAVSGLNRISVQPLMGKNETTYGVFGSGKFVMVSTSGAYTTPISQGVTSTGALFRHRVFVGVRGGVLKYSAPEDFRNFTESVDAGGCIRFPDGGGEIIAIKVHDDALYVFFNSGIIRLEIGGDPCEYRAEKIDYTGGDIYARTICVCDHAIYFMCKSGIYRLNGKKVERLDVGVILPQEESGLEGCAVWKGLPLFRYVQSNGVYKTLAIRADGSAFFMSDLEGLGHGENGKVLFVDAGKRLYQLVNDGEGEIWFSGYFSTVDTDFGYVGRKSLRKLRLFGEGTVEVSLWNGYRSVYKTLTFENGVTEWKLTECGETFRFYITLHRASKIRELHVEFDTVTSYKEDKS